MIFALTRKWLKRKHSGNGFFHLREKHPEKILTPDQMLDDRDINESGYYPLFSIVSCASW